MAMIYTHLSDTTIRTEYERALASGERVARPALETMLDPMRITDADVDWLKTNFVKTELELGHCLPAAGRTVRVRPLPALPQVHHHVRLRAPPA
jgi:hypothetical protein